MSSQAANSAAIDVKAEGAGNTSILVSGEIIRGDDERFASIAATIDGEATVLLSGPGGNLAAGLHIGTAIRLRAWKTTVPGGSICASACGLIWLGGVQRGVGSGALVGFHAAWVQGPDGIKREVGSGNALVGSYLGSLGLKDTAIIYLTSAPPDDALWLTQSIANQVGIRAEFAGAPLLAAPQVASPQRPTTTFAAPRLSSGVAGAQTELDRTLVGMLYSNYPASVRLPQESCSDRPCKLRLVAQDRWSDSDGAEHAIVAAVAEVKDDCHACAAILGLGQFRRSPPRSEWEREVITPATERVGGYGVFGGKITFVDGGHLGRVVRVDDYGGGMGEFGDYTALFAVKSGKFQQILGVSTSLSVGASCDALGPDCQKKVASADYTSRLSAFVADDGKLHIQQAFAAAHSIPTSTWVVEADGTINQIAGSKVATGATADERAAASNPTFAAGHSDRIAFEAWVSGLSEDGRAGAQSWAGRRSLRVPGDCSAPMGSSSEWSAGCMAARNRLASIDARRRAESEYRRGWNSL